VNTKLNSTDRLTRIEAKVDQLLHNEPVEGKGALGGKRVVHLVDIVCLETRCGEPGDVFTLRREFTNCKLCLKVEES
jgi:hypothetical protein